MDFVTSAFSYSHSSSSNYSAIENGWYFSLTPFPSGSEFVPLFDKIVPYSEKLESFTSIYDVQTFFQQQDNLQAKNPKLYPQTFFFIIELSRSTRELVNSICNMLKSFFSDNRQYYVGIVIVGSTIRFPMIRKDEKNFSMVTWPDARTEVKVSHESIYFNLENNFGLFLKYLDMIMEMPVEEPKINIHSLFYLFKSFIIGLRNPVIVITSELPACDKNQLKLIGDEFFKLSVSCEFFIMGNSKKESLNEFSRQCNCSVNYYCSNQYYLLINKLVKKLKAPRLIFTEVEIITSDSLQLKKILGRGKISDNNNRIFKLSKLTTNDTIHFYINPLFNKFKTIPPKITAIVRYFDKSMNCYKRVFPIDCSVYITNPISLISSAAIKIIIEKQNINIINDLLHFDLSQYDNFFQQRFKFAVNSLKCLQTSSFLANFCLSHHPKEIFDLLSPSCFDINEHSWKIMNNYINPIIVFLPEHYYLCIFPDNSEYKEDDFKSYLFSIDQLYEYDIITPSHYLENQYFIELKNMVLNQ